MRYEAFDDFVDLGVHERLAAGDGDDRSGALVDGIEALFGREIFFEDVGGILDFAASGAGEVAAEERLEHEDERIALAAGNFLAQDVSRDRPHLRYGNRHHPSVGWFLSMIPDLGGGIRPGKRERARWG